MTASKLQLFRLFLRERGEPEPFYRALAEQWVERFPFPLRDQLVLDVGAGGGWFTKAMSARGARVIATDLDPIGLAAAAEGSGCWLLADGHNLAIRSGTLDGVLCSNVLEHTPDPMAILEEIARVLRPNGWAYISWTNWLSPWGGHAIAPFHYLGPRAGLRARRLLFGEPRGRNLPGENLWVTYIGPILRAARTHPLLELVDAHPRYYPSQRWLLAIPGLREIATWNCVLMVRRRTAPRSIAPAGAHR